MRRPERAHVAGAALALASLALVLWLFLLQADEVSPGPLAAVHAREAELAGPEGCARCHGERGGSMAEGCATCHAAVERQIEAGTGFHGTLRGADAGDCALCHAEHSGEEFLLVNRRSFELAGLAAREDYDHAALDFRLAGRHAELACTDCHANADVGLLPRGAARFAGLSQACDACHEDAHEGRIARACADCHGQEHAFAEVAAFRHASFDARCAHSTARCDACHVPGSEREVEALAGTAPPPPERACADCHASPHSPSFDAGAAALADAAAGAGCAACHDPCDAGGFGGSAADAPRALHAASGFALVGPHAELACESCHSGADGAASFAPRSPPRAPGDCAACHADPHAGDFSGAFAARACADCHARERFAPSAFGAAEHALTAFPLDGAHERVACARCHAAPAGGGPPRFADAPTDCAACHADPHGGEFASGAFAGGCATCHSTARFAPSAFGPARHALAAFPLEASHAALPCASCHVPPAHGGPPRFDEAPRACAGCHADPHGGAFGARAARAGCAACHAPTLFSAVDARAFEHGAWTDFALAGAHARAACEACHPRAESADALGRRFGRAPGVSPEGAARCDGCHADPHGGRFDRPGLPLALDGRAGCARCHGEESFSPLRPELAGAAFDHARWTGYPLAPFHAALACERCHAPAKAPDALGRSFGRAAGARCSDCHADPHVGQFAVAGATDCARCHADGGELLFEHARDSRFALDALHERLACGECHVPWPLAGGGEAVRYRPLGTGCVDCHDPSFVERAGGKR